MIELSTIAVVLGIYVLVCIVILFVLSLILP